MSVQVMKRRIKKLLIANRGEVSLRVLRTAIEMGLQAVLVYEKPDREAYYIRTYEESILIGDGPRKDYLDVEKIIRIARETGADAVHPGYGFLSENPDFAEACERAGIVFVGPPSRVVRNLGNKVLAREIAGRAKIPCIPGSYDLPSGDEGIKQAADFARKHGYPVMIKASAGGGGRGIRKVQSEEELAQQIRRSRAEALKAFKSENVFVEKCIQSPRHVEIQVLADHHGSVVHLGSRDCSIQRRHQKMLEIAPASLPEDVLQKMYDAAVRVTREAGYVNAGTVEFLVDPQTNEFWFMEMNTRLQVEHTVTEELVNVDLVREQIKIAEGRPLDIPEGRIRLWGKAVQVRINAEDPTNNFAPQGGKTVHFYLPPGGPGIRLDGVIYEGYKVPTEYDSLLVKLTVRARNWEQTVERLQRALNIFLIVGPETTIPFYRAICRDPDFINEKFDTSYIETHPNVFRYPETSQEIRRIEKYIAQAHTSIFFPYVY
jgi:acetyl/propionyl-CoA carboxylase alpha subunit